MGFPIAISLLVEPLSVIITILILIFKIRWTLTNIRTLRVERHGSGGLSYSPLSCNWSSLHLIDKAPRIEVSRYADRTSLRESNMAVNLLVNARSWRFFSSAPGS